MLHLKSALSGLSLLGLLISLQASADEAICHNVKGAIEKLSASDRSSSNMDGVKPTYLIYALDGFLYGDSSGVLFNGNDAKNPQDAVPKIVGWGDGDVLVVHPPESQEQKNRGEKNGIHFFISYDEAPYNDPKSKGTRGGMYKVSQGDWVTQHGVDGVKCSPNAADYSHHFFPKSDVDGKNPAPKVGDVFCILDRKGTSYSLVKVEYACDNGLVFDHKFNGENNFFATEHSKLAVQTAEDQAGYRSMYGHH